MDTVKFDPTNLEQHFPKDNDNDITAISVENNANQSVSVICLFLQTNYTQEYREVERESVAITIQNYNYN